MPARKSLDQLVGQLLIFGFEGTGFDGTAQDTRLTALLADTRPAGIILFARNIQSPRQTHGLLKSIRRLVEQPFLCVDMEGGAVDRLRDAIAPAPSVADVAAAGRRELFKEHGLIIGAEARALGFNVDFAPVLDLRLDGSLNVLGSRTASSEPPAIVAYARQFLAGLNDAGILGCGKHFPGLGEANLDSHFALPSVEKPWKNLWAEDLAPYRALARQVPLVMVAHCAYPAVTRDSTPASISQRWITGVLRKKIGYRGLVISDDLEMGGVLASLPIEEAAIAAIRAGADLFLVCHKEENVRRCYEAVLRQAERDVRFRRRVEQAARRVLAFKRKSPALNRRFPAPPSDAAVDRLRRRIWLLGEQLRAAAGSPENRPL